MIESAAGDLDETYPPHFEMANPMAPGLSEQTRGSVRRKPREYGTSIVKR
jgi:hypothetical protein